MRSLRAEGTNSFRALTFVARQPQAAAATHRDRQERPERKVQQSRKDRPASATPATEATVCSALA